MDDDRELVEGTPFEDEIADAEFKQRFKTVGEIISNIGRLNIKRECLPDASLLAHPRAVLVGAVAEWAVVVKQQFAAAEFVLEHSCGIAGLSRSESRDLLPELIGKLARLHNVTQSYQNRTYITQLITTHKLRSVFADMQKTFKAFMQEMLAEIGGRRVIDTRPIRELNAVVASQPPIDWLCDDFKQLDDLMEAEREIAASQNARGAELDDQCDDKFPYVANIIAQSCVKPPWYSIDAKWPFDPNHLPDELAFFIDEDEYRDGMQEIMKVCRETYPLIQLFKYISYVFVLFIVGILFLRVANDLELERRAFNLNAALRYNEATRKWLARGLMPELTGSPYKYTLRVDLRAATYKENPLAISI